MVVSSLLMSCGHSDDDDDVGDDWCHGSVSIFRAENEGKMDEGGVNNKDA